MSAPARDREPGGVAPGVKARGSAQGTPPIDGLAQAYLTPARVATTLAILAAILIAVAIVAAAFGSVHISLIRAIADRASADHAILFGVRMPRVVLGAIVGAVLAAVGAALQALVRNPLAEGGILGISGGGAFGAIVAMVIFSRLGGADAMVPLCAFGAALLSTLAVYRLALVDGRLEPFTLLLVGVIFNSFWGAAIMLVNSVVNFYFTHSIIFWLMGSFEAPTWREVAMVAVLGGAGCAVLMTRARDLNLLSLGDDEAAELGVEVDALRRTIFAVTSIMIGAAVSVSGIISFVGLIVPHILRVTLGADHRLLIPASILGGAAFTVAADLVARVAIAPAELPVGAITALCGGPFFIYVLRREGRKALAS
ncbi:MAG: iron ABC transporter permease [Candidatus Binataceae bacterium]|nr:iron ABC transporter permease [Candidatus Binataceae bacterium]